MKKLYFAALLATCSLSGFSQDDVDCYNYYYKVFEQRGAYNVQDGVHEDVIVSIRSGNETECYEGKVEVKNGSVSKIFLEFEDKTYEAYSPKFKNDYATTIKNGVSRSQITMEDEIVNIFFLEKIKPKKKKYKKAKLRKLEDL